MRLNGKFISKILSAYCFAWCLGLIFTFSLTNNGFAQTNGVDTQRNNANRRVRATRNRVSDTLATPKEVATDTTSRASLAQKLGIRISKDALTAVVTAYARDSAIMDVRDNTSYLYGNTQVNYTDLQLNAGQVMYEQQRNKVVAAPSLSLTDTGSGKRGTFSQGNEKFSYDSVQYNFKSKRAIVRNTQTQYGEGFIHSEQIKRNGDQVIYGSRSLYTTCALDTPHFGILASKLKIVPGKVVVSGPANLFIEGVPTPLVLPCALFPVSARQKSGFVLPTYTVEQQRGLGLLNGGYYFYLNDRADLLMQTNIFTKGSYAVSGLTNYSNRYHYNGTLNLSYAYNKTGETFEPGATEQRDFMFNWRHTSDPKSVPGQSFNASVQVGTSSFYANNSLNPNQILQNQYQSNITYSKNWQSKPFGLTVSALHNQNTLTKRINVTLPSINFHVTQFNPFARKNSIGTHWYDKITSSYNVDAINQGTFFDSTFNLANISNRTFNSGIKHTIPVSANYTLLRYINFSANVSYNEYWFLERETIGYNDATRKIDTASRSGLFTVRDFSTSLNFSTRIYGMKLFKKGKLKGIRHVLTPNASLSYRPDFSESPFNYYYRTRLDTSSREVVQTPFLNSVIGLPPTGKSGLISFGLNNNLQIKVRSAKDTTSGYKNVTLIDGFSINGSYNMMADSFRWSNVGVAFRTNVADKINISSSASYDPYAFNYNTGRRLPTTLIDNGTGALRFSRANLSLGSNFHGKTKSGAKGPTNSEEYARLVHNAGYGNYVDFNIPWSLNLSYSLDAAQVYNSRTKRDSLQINHNLQFNGELQVSERWKVTFNSGYNFRDKQLTLTSIDVYRDLHCWAMHFQTFPFGPRKSFNFTLNVKATVLQDLKLQRRRDFRDSPL
jgi:hypothetical protein